MRQRLLVIFALLSCATDLSAQGIRLPRRRGETTDQPTPLPPQAVPVARSLEYTRSRWSTEGYTLASRVLAPAASGGVTSYSTLGAGTHADYRFTEHVSATIDLTASPLGGSSTSETAEVGTRFSPMSWDHQVRPFLDVRAAYMHLFDTFVAADGSVVSGGSPLVAGQYSRGFGAVGGAGIEYSLTARYALVSELSGMRNRMTTYRISGQPTAPTGTAYWMTSFRYLVGFKFTPVTALHDAQKP